ncbi:MAG: DUF4412 domain-containing protein [Bacteroidetes bacterium]|nr:DUF4412 domain-containing protein [Bacteroidota bacterium]
MKKLTLTLILGIIIFNGFSQDTFEGTISFKVNIIGENAEQMAQFMPQGYEFSFKGTKSIFKISGGMMAQMMGEIIVDNQTGSSYMINHAEKVAYKMENTMNESVEGMEISRPTITKLDEEVEILGYNCQKYKVVSTMQDQTMESFIWVSKDIVVHYPKNSGNMPGGSGAFYFPELEGFPLKMVNNLNSGMGLVKMEMVAVNVERKALEDSLFAIPEGYEEKNFDPSMLMNSMMKKN